MTFDSSTVATLFGIAVLLLCYLRVLSVMYVDGKFDLSAKQVFVSASLVPLGAMLGGMLLGWLVLSRVGASAGTIPWVVGGIAIVGSACACERGVRAVKAHRASRP